mmetsp:Transcript_1897/g.3927  ORF Transcript_1897/g.3927 Transcript_1897/m.3927 type:complete len:809 (+) Transcript_1897:114-2540(+)
MPAASPSVYLLSTEHLSAGWSGVYDKAARTSFHGRGAYVKRGCVNASLGVAASARTRGEAQESSHPSCQAIWFTGQGWLAGRSTNAGGRTGVLSARDKRANSPDQVKVPWHTASVNRSRWVLAPSVRCLPEAEGQAAAAAAAAAQHAAVMNAIGAAPRVVYLLALSAEHAHVNRRWFGAYNRTSYPINNRPSYSRNGCAHDEAATPDGWCGMMWFSDAGWLAGRRAQAGGTLAVLSAMDREAATPDAVRAAWHVATEDAWVAAPTIRCVSEADGEAAAAAAVSAEAAALNAAIAGAPQTVHLVSRINATVHLSSRWYSRYSRTPHGVNGRVAYSHHSCTGGAEPRDWCGMIWFAEQAWMVGERHDVGSSSGVLTANDADAQSPDRVRAVWHAAGGADGWVPAPAVRCIADASAGDASFGTNFAPDARARGPPRFATSSAADGDVDSATSPRTVYLLNATATGLLSPVGTGALRGWLGAYSQTQPLNGRPAYARRACAGPRGVHANGAKCAMMWYNGVGWMVGREVDAGSRSGFIVSSGDALTPDGVSGGWSMAVGNGSGWAPLPSLRCVAGKAAEAAVAAAAAAHDKDLRVGAHTVYLISSKTRLDALRSQWLGAYHRLKSLPPSLAADRDVANSSVHGLLVNGRSAYAKRSPTPHKSTGRRLADKLAPSRTRSSSSKSSSSKSSWKKAASKRARRTRRALWWAQGSWFVGMLEDVGLSRGVLAVADESAVPERVHSQWRAAPSRKECAHPETQAEPLSCWRLAPDVRCIGGADGKAEAERVAQARALAHPSTTSKSRRTDRKHLMKG